MKIGLHRERLRPGRGFLRCAVLGVAVLSLVGCTRGSTSRRPPIHLNPNMDLQPKYMPQAESAFFYDGASMRTPVEGTVARGRLREDSELFQGKDATGEFVTTNPLAGRNRLEERGQERYSIYCLPCHGDSGNGRGMLFERAGVQSGDLHDPRIASLSDGQMFDVVTNGVGLMSGYAYPISPEDRWAIIAYVRQLQQESR